jgi:DNA-3-methyladenine glycosylase II
LKSIVNKHDIAHLLQIEHVFEAINSKYGPPPNWSRPQGFVSLSKIILEQQVSLASAVAHFNKLSGYIKDFTPENILRLNNEEMLKCHISRQKALYLRELSKSILNGTTDLERLSDLDESEIRRQLTALKGIGQWTTDIYLMFCLQSKDIFPLGDVALINAARELFNVRTKEETGALSEKWKPIRSLAAYYLWHHYLCKRNRTDITNPGII